MKALTFKQQIPSLKFDVWLVHYILNVNVLGCCVLLQSQSIGKVGRSEQSQNII